MSLDTQIKKAIATYIWGTGADSAALATATTSIEYFDGGQVDFLVARTPMLGITVIEDLNVTATATVTSTSYTYDPLIGAVYLKNGSEWGQEGNRRRYAVTYTYGFTSIPEDIQLAIDSWTSTLTANLNGALAGYSTGDDSESYDSTVTVSGIPSQVKRLLQPYRRMLF